MRIKSDRAKKKWFIIDPNDQKKSIWSITILICIVYTCVMTPFRESFYTFQELEIKDFWFFLETIIDIIFALDIFVNFISAYENINGNIVYSYKQIAANYIKGFFWVDFFTVMPSLIDTSSYENTDISLGATRYFKVARLHRLVRMGRVIKIFKMYQYSFAIGLQRMKFPRSSLRILNLIIKVMFSVHFVACLWNLSGKLYDYSPDTWLYVLNYVDKSTIQVYTYSVYWACQTLTTVGYGEFGCYNLYEIFITIIWMGFGAMFYSILVGTLTSVIIEEVLTAGNLTKKIKAVESFSEAAHLDHKISTQMKQFLSNNFNEIFSKVDEEAMIKELPSKLREELLFHQNYQIINKFEFLSTANNNQFVWTIIKNLMKIQYDMNDIIYNDNSLADCIFLIHKGLVKLYAENGYPFISFRVKEHFGDNDSMLNQRRMGTAKSMAKRSQMYKLNKQQLDEVLEDYPEIKKEIYR